MTDANEATGWFKPVGTSPEYVIISAMQHFAVGDIYTGTGRGLAKLTGYEVSTVSQSIRAMMASGAIERLAETSGLSPSVFRIIDAGLVSSEMTLRWTPERQELLRRLWPDTDRDAVLAALNALPGPEVHLSQLHNQVARLGVKRSPEYMHSLQKAASVLGSMAMQKKGRGQAETGGEAKESCEERGF